MKTEYIVKIEELKRIPLPDEIVHTLHWGKGTKITMTVKGRHLVVKLYTGKCALCNSEKHIQVIWGTPVCRECVEELNRIMY